MNSILEEYLKVAKPEHDIEALEGLLVPVASFIELPDDLKPKIPLWMVKMLTEYPIAGLLFRFKTIDDDIKAIQFIGADALYDHSIVMSPGKFLIDHGYICIADDPTGEENPFFFKLTDGDNPPIYQIKGTFSEDWEELVKYGSTKVANRLSDIFANQVGLE